jgi:hypothetical protein
MAARARLIDFQSVMIAPQAPVEIAPGTQAQFRMDEG